LELASEARTNKNAADGEETYPCDNARMLNHPFRVIPQRLGHRVLLGIAAAFGAVAIARSPSLAAQSETSCSLLKPADLGQLSSGAQIPEGKPSSDALGTLTCRYEWGSGGNAVSGQYNLDVSVGENAKYFPGMDQTMLKRGLIASAGRPGNALIPDVGEAAYFSSNGPNRARTTAIVQGKTLTVTLEGPDAPAKKDQMIALLRLAVSRL
jgi:hypothetical protein